MEASVEPIALPLSHPLAQTHGAENCLLIEPEIGEPWIVSGTGAGRWPTTEAVMADLFEIRREAQLLEVTDELADLEECVA